MNRRLLAAAGALALALVASACSTVQPDAARVDGTSIRQSDFEERLQGFVDDPQFAANPNLLEPGTGQVSNGFARQLLYYSAIGTFARNANEAAGTEVPTDDAFQQQVRTLSAQVAGFDPGSGQWSLVEEGNRAPIEDDIAQILTLLRAYEAEADDPEAVAAFYAENPGRFALLCSRHILVATEAEALAVIDRIEAGEDFGEVAGEVSVDGGSAVDGGRLYVDGEECPAATGFDGDFVAGALSVPPGELSDPVQTQFGYHVILTDEVVERPLDAIQPEVAEAMRSLAGARVLEDFRSADVWVNPRFGVLDTESGFIDAPVIPGILN